MKNKILISVLAVFLVFLISCQQAPKKEVTGTAKITAPGSESTPNAAVDSIGNDITAASADEKDLGTDGLSDVDSGLSEVQNI